MGSPVAAPREGQDGTGFTGAVTRIVTFWALLGGALLLIVVALNMASVIAGIFGAPLPGDFELTEMGVAVAAFAFLPYCQITGANVTADIFTSGASPRVIAFLSLIGALVALAFSALLIWRMYAGLLDQKAYDYTTAILQVPHWWAFVPILASLGLLALSALASLMQEARRLSPEGKTDE
ncbi:TRAP transporter small permease [Pseudooceanicola sp. CBS1P-1]|uniref:TRAP transporter small permease protein n=1 Tax=Pseudooceanicola albus TaxID=2692189 RepID=A0A6L7G541_9RHOB|nr:MULTISPECIES: TRAP transporter small permease [Pseudooceanicola]MBT9385090.1 TRAP transporter small permease [Pseudooceanicola endophyticus]MXN18618.1 TRAP transporter small permease subunit [Pseudooceanicola albus]